jgi:hypothetical protein
MQPDTLTNHEVFEKEHYVVRPSSTLVPEHHAVAPSTSYPLSDEGLTGQSTGRWERMNGAICTDCHPDQSWRVSGTQGEPR